MRGERAAMSDGNGAAESCFAVFTAFVVLVLAGWLASRSSFESKLKMLVALGMAILIVNGLSLWLRFHRATVKTNSTLPPAGQVRQLRLPRLPSDLTVCFRLMTPYPRRVVPDASLFRIFPQFLPAVVPQAGIAFEIPFFASVQFHRRWHFLVAPRWRIHFV